MNKQMLQFHPIQLEDKKWIDPLLAASDNMGGSYSFANNLAWQRLGNSEVCSWGGFYLNKQETAERISFLFPAGKGDLAAVLRTLMDYANLRGRPLILFGASAQAAAFVQQQFPGRFSVTADRDDFDYIYRLEDLRTLAGRKYHQKRNHLKKFQAYPFTYAPLTEADYEDCIRLSAECYLQKNGIAEYTGQVEQLAIHTFFMHFRALGLMGGTLRVDGKLVAFTVGERINSNTLCVHIEKGDIAYEGVYPAINYYFVNHVEDPAIAFVNREEDMGLPGLRKSKLSYHPVMLLEKYQLVQTEFHKEGESL